MAMFPQESVSDALEHALRNAKHLRVRDAPAVAALRALAGKIDAWDTIVAWAREDAAGIGRPAVPANDNVSIPSFLKGLAALQLLPPPVEAAKEKAKPGPAPQASPQQQAINEMRANLRVV